MKQKKSPRRTTRAKTKTAKENISKPYSSVKKRRATVRIGPKTYAKLPAAQKKARARALEAISLSRQGISPSKAAKQAGTTLATVRKYAVSAFEKKSGRLHVKKNDRLYRPPIKALTTEGMTKLTPQSSYQASILSRHAHAVDSAARGEIELLAKFEGINIDGHWLETDLDVIEDLAYQGQLDYEGFYQSVT